MDIKLNSPKQKKIRSPGDIDTSSLKHCVTCNNVPESLFDATNVKKHFSKFGRVQKIRLFPKKQIIMIEYDQLASAEKAVLNAGAFDGFMFDVTRTKPKMRRHSKKEDDPDWVPDSDVEEELSAMSNTPTYSLRKHDMDVDQSKQVAKSVKPVKVTPVRKKVKEATVSNSSSSLGTVMTTTSLSTLEAAAELVQLKSRISLTPDEQWHTLDARDRILRQWGGAGARLKVGGATIGTCQDMCPEKERLHREAEHQVMNLECRADGAVEAWRVVKQYSRSSADQEVPMCYELRPPASLARTAAYLLWEIADTERPISLADWFHFLWDRFRGIRKDITQQALCCSDSIRLVEYCARFHAHCAARLADLEYTQFDQKLNTDNLTKCLQTLKHMYADVSSDLKPKEAEFRGYIALLNLGDSNFWWEIKQLPQEIQKSAPITFAIKVFNALDNNNYIRFFRLVREEATYLQACILLRYFNDVRARALARIVKAFSPRGGSRYPAHELVNALAFETFDVLRSFINHYGLRCGVVDDTEVSVILDRNQFIEDSDPYPIAREINLIESKRNSSVGEVIAGGELPQKTYQNHILYSSFNVDGTIKASSLVAVDLGYSTTNDTNKDLNALKLEVQKDSFSTKFTNNNEGNSKLVKNKSPFTETLKKLPGRPNNIDENVSIAKKSFSFKPAIPVANSDVIKKSPEKFVETTKSLFSFSKPQESETTSIFAHAKSGKENTNVLQNSVFQNSSDSVPKAKLVFGSKNILSGNLFTQTTNAGFTKLENSDNVFALNSNNQINTDMKSLFGNEKFAQTNSTNNSTSSFSNSIFNAENSAQKVTSPGSLFKSYVNKQSDSNFSIFQTKNTNSQIPVVGPNIFSNALKKTADSVYEFNDEREDKLKEDQRLLEEFQREKERKREEERLKELHRKEEESRKLQAEQKRLEENRRQEERQREEQKRQEELKRKIEKEKKDAELKQKAEDEKRFHEMVEKESLELVENTIDEVCYETVDLYMKEESNILNWIISYGEDTYESILSELCNEICLMEIKAEQFYTAKLSKKWFCIWRMKFSRNRRRRMLLDNTPVWITDRSPVESANILRRVIEPSALKKLNDVNKGIRFNGELNAPPIPDPYNVVEIIRSSLLKRMKQIKYPYDRCFFWKITLISPGSKKYLFRKLDIHQWLIDAFSDKQSYKPTDSLIHVSKYSWNNLINFALSVGFSEHNTLRSEALEGTNGLIFYFTDADDCLESIKNVVKYLYPYQIVPVAILMPKSISDMLRNQFETGLANLVNTIIISNYKIFHIEEQNFISSLDSSTRSALKWLARRYPQIPPLQIDLLKSICQRYLGNEIWCQLKMKRENVKCLVQDLPKLVELYNIAVDKLTETITDKDSFHYASFPLEFKQYLEECTPYPKSYEHIPSCVKTDENVDAIKSIMDQLKLPNICNQLQIESLQSVQEGIRKYCKQIGWSHDTETMVCKVVSVLPDEFFDVSLPCEKFHECFRHYNLIDLLNVMIYEKINSLGNFENRLAIYKVTTLEEYRNYLWWYQTDVVTSSLEERLDYSDDEIDYVITAKRRKISKGHSQHLMLEDNDITMTEQSLQCAVETINKYENCKETVNQLENQLELERTKSIELENLLRTALSEN